jgi:hypothetical protein
MREEVLVLSGENGTTNHRRDVLVLADPPVFGGHLHERQVTSLRLLRAKCTPFGRLAVLSSPLPGSAPQLLDFETAQQQTVHYPKEVSCSTWKRRRRWPRRPAVGKKRDVLGRRRRN